MCFSPLVQVHWEVTNATRKAASTPSHMESINSLAFANPWSIVNFTIPTPLDGFKSPCIPMSTILRSQSPNPWSEFIRYAKNDDESRYFKKVFYQKDNDLNITNSTENLLCLPYFVLIGFPKCGTTDLWYRLTQHMSIFGPSRKEAHWFDFRHKTLSHYWYLFKYVTEIIDGRTEGINKKLPASTKIKSPRASLLHTNNSNTMYVRYNETARRNIVIGDFSPGYSWNEDFWDEDPANANQSEPVSLIPHKIKHLLPHAKIIAILRNPVDRLWSDFEFHFGRNFINKASRLKQTYFHARVKTGIKWWSDCTNAYNFTMKQCAYGHHYPKPIRTLSYFNAFKDNKKCGRRFHCNWKHNPGQALRRGIYYVYLKQWFEVFGKSNLLVLKAEDYYKAPVRTIQTVILPFLDTVPFRDYADEESHSSSSGKRVSMLSSTRQLLHQFYSPFNDLLAGFLNDSRYKWE